MSGPFPPSIAATGATTRDLNRRRVLLALQGAEGGTSHSQADLARATSLAPATVHNIVRDLLSLGVVESEAGSGRRGGAVRISAGAGLVAGVDFGHHHLRVLLADLSGDVVAYDRLPLPSDHDHEWGLEQARTLLERVTAAVGRTAADVQTIGLGLPAPLDARGVVLSSTILPGWEGVDAREATRERLGRPVVVDNDANLGALAEHRRGAGRGHPTMVFVKASSGLGAGVVIDGQLFHGSSGTAGELGHLTRDPDGHYCRCGSRGCLEAYVSTTSAIDAVSSILPGSTFEEVVEAALAGNVAAQRVFEDAGEDLGWGLAMVASLINPSRVVVGGQLAAAGDLLLESVRTGLRRHTLAGVAQATEVVAAELSERAPAIGAMLTALDATDLLPATA